MFAKSASYIRPQAFRFTDETGRTVDNLIPFTAMRKSVIWKYNDFLKITNPKRGWTKNYNKASSKPHDWRDKDTGQKQTLYIIDLGLALSPDGHSCVLEKNHFIFWGSIHLSVKPQKGYFLYSVRHCIKILAHWKFSAHIRSLETELA